MLEITMSEVQNPVRFRGMVDAPEKLYVVGNLPDDARKTVFITGARISSAYGRYMARQYGQAFGAAGWQVLTDLSLGCGGIAARGALSAGGRVFAVMGCGADVCYTPENRDIYNEIIKTGGGIISEYPEGTLPKPAHFETRRNILVSLADVVVIIEARKKSGPLAYAQMAADYAKPVYALPGRVTDRLSDGTCALIKYGGAQITLSPDDIMGAFSNVS